MTFQAQVNQELQIDGVPYRIAEHPHAPGMPYGQEGRQAVVYQLIADQERKALKVFKPRYRLPGLVVLANQIEPFAQLPGLQVCKRTVLTPRRHPSLLRQHPDLTYAVLMPWIEGPTWLEVLLGEREFTPEQSLQLTRSMAEILADMEEHRIAHCDLSCSNMLLPALANESPNSGHLLVQLVDVEQIYGPNIDRPDVLPGGSSGYAHPSTSGGVWSPVADRFSGAVLLAEMLGWCDERVRAGVWGESYFDPHEMQKNGERHQMLLGVIRSRWGAGLAGLLEQVWRSETLPDCPTFGEWLVAMPESVPQATTELGSATTTSAVVLEQPTTERSHDEVKEDRSAFGTDA